LRPLHWHKGTEAFHEDSKRFSVLPCSEPLIFPQRSSTSEEAEDKEAGSPRVVPSVKKKRSKKKTMQREKRFRSAMKEAKERERERERKRKVVLSVRERDADERKQQERRGKGKGRGKRGEERKMKKKNKQQTLRDKDSDERKQRNRRGKEKGRGKRKMKKKNKAPILQIRAERYNKKKDGCVNNATLQVALHFTQMQLICRIALVCIIGWRVFFVSMLCIIDLEGVLDHPM
jgi:hypothetical protein